MIADNYVKLTLRASTRELAGYTDDTTDLAIPEIFTDEYGVKYKPFKIGSCAFFQCENLTSVVIPKGVTEINDMAFMGCKNLLTVTIPDTIKKISPYAFNMCDNLCNVIYTGTEEQWNVIDIYGSNDALTSAEREYEYTGFIVESLSDVPDISYGNIIIPETSTDDSSTDESSKYSNIETIIIPETFTIDDIKYKVVGIGDEAFKDSNIKSIIIPDSVLRIGNSAFEGCTSLELIHLPIKLLTIGDNAFKGCKYLAHSIILNSQFIPDDVTIPDVIIETNTNSFDEYEMVTTAFNFLFIPDSVLYIGESAFEECECLIHITIGDEVVTINDNTFSKCKELNTIVIPGSVVDILSNAFNGCEKLKTVFYKSKEVSWNRIGLGGGNGSLEQCLIVYEYE